MKVALVFLLAVISVAVAGSTPKQLGFRNLYVKTTTSEVSRSKPGPKIIGGVEAVPHSVPAQAFMTFSDSSYSWYCGGTLITPRTVLSAGHCGDGADSAHVILGAHTPLSNENTQFKVRSYILKIHEGYDKNSIANDISIVVLPEAVVLTEAIQLIALPSSATDLYVGEIGTISGWGYTDGSGSAISLVLNKVDVEIITNAECQLSYGDFVIDSNICASGDDGKGACNGDSGGPLAVNGTQVGIVSFGKNGCPPGAPSAFTRVTSYLDWIAENSVN